MSKADLEAELRMERKALQHLRVQAAMYGIGVPPHIPIGIENAELRIAQLEAALGREQTEPRQLPRVERPTPRNYERERQQARERDISHQLEMLRIHRARIAVLRQQVKRLGDYAPPHQRMEIREGISKIAEVKRALDRLGAAYDNLPGDE